MASRLKVAVVGLGNQAKWCHIEQMKEMEDEFEIAYLVDIDGDKAREVSREYGLKGTDNLEEVLKDASVEMVSVVTPCATHREITKRALQAGKNVLVEKPMATTVQECDEMIEEARRAGKVLGVFHQRRWYANQRVIKEVLERGDLGRLISVRLVMSSEPEKVAERVVGPESGLPFEKRFALSPACDGFVHYPDKVNHLLGERATRLFSRASFLEGSDIPYHWEIFLDYPSGVLGTVELIPAAIPPPKWLISGTKGTLVMEQGNNFGPMRMRIKRGNEWVEEEIPEKWPIGDSFKIVYRGMKNAIRKGSPPPVSARDGREALRILYKALESVKKGVAVKL